MTDIKSMPWTISMLLSIETFSQLNWVASDLVPCV